MLDETELFSLTLLLDNLSTIFIFSSNCSINRLFALMTSEIYVEDDAVWPASFRTSSAPNLAKKSGLSW